MKNIHLFETEAAYDAAKSGLILPRVSYIEETKVVNYNPPHHDYVEIAGIKWATMNVGAKSVTDYGLYFQWGDTQGYTAEQVGKKEDGKKPFAEDWSDYKYTSAFTKYNTSDKKSVLDLEDDAVHAAWGGSWRMPITEEFQKLSVAVNTGWTDSYKESGVAGMVCSAKDDTSKTLFFPACGYARSGSNDMVGSYAYYWSSSIYSNNVSNAYDLFFFNGYVDWQEHYHDRYCGMCVRGVLAEK